MKIEKVELSPEILGLVADLKKDPNNTRAMGKLYRLVDRDNRDDIGNLLVLNAKNKFESHDYLEALAKNAVRIELIVNPHVGTYLREPTLSTKLIYLEAASRMDKSDVKMFMAQFNKFCTKFHPTDSQVSYYTPVYNQMLNDAAYKSDDPSLTRQKIGTSLAFNLILLPMLTKLNMEKREGDALNVTRLQAKLLKLSDETKAEFPAYVQLLNGLVDRVAAQATPVNAAAVTASSTTVDSPELQRPARNVFFGRLFKSDKPEPEKSFIDMLKEQSPSTQPAVQRIAKLSDIEIASRHIDTVEGMMKDEDMEGKPLVKAIDSACDRIEKTVDFTNVDRHDAEDLVTKLRNLYSDAGGKIPAEEIERLDTRITKIEDNFSASSRSTPAK